MTLEQIEQHHAGNPHRAELVKQLREELDYWKAISSALRAWIYGPFLGMAETPDAINVLLIAVLKPADPNAPHRIRRPQIQVHFRLGKELVDKAEMVRTFNSLPQNIENNLQLDPERVVELVLQ
ncbi:MAG: hypothetical protein ABSH20_06775 [Tepidisphaeraceae bacterium]